LATDYIFKKDKNVLAVVPVGVAINAVFFHVALDPQKINNALTLLAFNASIL
jgi:hypothetical protein